jgi:hypothetical protein
MYVVVLVLLPAPLPLVVLPLVPPVPPLSATMMQPLAADMPAAIVATTTAQPNALAMIEASR